MPLKLYKYSESFVSLFENEKNKLRILLGDKCVIEHIGSTAIPATDGKGVIDIMIGFEDQNNLDTAIKLIQKSGFILADYKIERKERVFMSSSGNRESDFGDIHLHLVIKTSEDFLNAILFRDFMRNNEKERQEYIDLKYQLWEKVGDDRKKYTQMKKEFIERIVEMAKKRFLGV